MRTRSTYLILGFAVWLAIDYLAPQSATTPATLGQIARPASSAASPGASAPLHVVDRTLKGDRLLVNASQHAAREAVRSQSAPATRAVPINHPREPKILIGCDPAFSPLSVPAGLNFAGRCLVENAPARKSYAALR